MARQRVAAQAFTFPQGGDKGVINRQQRILMRGQFQQLTGKGFYWLAFALGLCAIDADDAAFLVVQFFLFWAVKVLSHVRFRFSAGHL